MREERLIYGLKFDYIEVVYILSTSPSFHKATKRKKKIIAFNFKAKLSSQQVAIDAPWTIASKPEVLKRQMKILHN